MPAKKITSTPIAQPTPTTMLPILPAQMLPQYAPPQYAMPIASTLALPTQIVATADGSSSAITMMESQMKAMREYLATMEKTFKEAKKGLKKGKRTPKDPNALPKEKGPIPEGTKAWNDFVVLVQTEETAKLRASMPADWKGTTRKEAMAKAKELRIAGDPRYNYVKKEKPITVAPTAAAAPAAPTPTAAAAAAPKKRGRKPTVAAPTLNAAAPAFSPYSLPIASIAAPTEEEDLELEEVTIVAKQYVMSKKSEVWNMEADGSQGSWVGIYNGVNIIAGPEPSY